MTTGSNPARRSASARSPPHAAPPAPAAPARAARALAACGAASRRATPFRSNGTRSASDAAGSGTPGGGDQRRANPPGLTLAHHASTAASAASAAMRRAAFGYSSPTATGADTARIVSAAPVGSSSGHASAMTDTSRAARAYRGGWSVRRHAAAPQNTCGYRIASASRRTSENISERVSRRSPARSAAAAAERADTPPNPADGGRHRPCCPGYRRPNSSPRATVPPSAAAAEEHNAASNASAASGSRGARSAANTRADADANGKDAARRSQRRASSAHCSLSPGSNTSASGRSVTSLAMDSGDHDAPPSEDAPRAMTPPTKAFKPPAPPPPGRASIPWRRATAARPRDSSASVR